MLPSAGISSIAEEEEEEELEDETRELLLDELLLEEVPDWPLQPARAREAKMDRRETIFMCFIGTFLSTGLGEFGMRPNCLNNEEVC